MFLSKNHSNLQTVKFSIDSFLLNHDKTSNREQCAINDAISSILLSKLIRDYFEIVLLEHILNNTNKYKKSSSVNFENIRQKNLTMSLLDLVKSSHMFGEFILIAKDNIDYSLDVIKA
jgi:hypothetical protein